MYHKTLADGFFVFSFFAIFLALIGFLLGDIWLASTQWMLVAIFTVLVGIYVKLSAQEDEEILKSQNKKKTPTSKAATTKKRRTTTKKRKTSVNAK
jgi:hypothetical protein